MRLRLVVHMLTCSSLALAGFVSCGGSTSAITAQPSDDAGSTSDDASPQGDDASTTFDGASGDAPPDGNGLDGNPKRIACTVSLGNALTTTYGRLDGFLVSVVRVNTHGCNGDSTHVHLQVAANNATYDIAVNVDGLFYQQDITLPSAWTEGWHTGITSAYADMGVHTPMFAMTNVQALALTVENAVANANHVSIFATGYGPDGAHLVHFQGHKNDGMVVLEPLGPTPHALMFAFAGDTF